MAVFITTVANAVGDRRFTSTVIILQPVDVVIFVRDAPGYVPDTVVVKSSKSAWCALG